MQIVDVFVHPRIDRYPQYVAYNRLQLAHLSGIKAQKEANSLFRYLVPQSQNLVKIFQISDECTRLIFAGGQVILRVDQISEWKHIEISRPG